MTIVNVTRENLDMRIDCVPLDLLLPKAGGGFGGMTCPVQRSRLICEPTFQTVWLGIKVREQGGL